MHDEFVNIEFSHANIDRYQIRSVILNSIRMNLPVMKGKLLDIGCGKMPYKEHILKNSSVNKYIGLDIESALEYDKNVKPDHTWDGITMPFSNNEFDCAFGTEVLEHCPQPGIILSEVYRVLKPGGNFFFTVPFLWPLHEVPHDEYRYTPFSLKRLLEQAGFEKIKINATGGWHASMAQMLGLWVRRSPLKERSRKILSYVAKPIIKRLIQKDLSTKVDFNESQMITGLSGIAYKPL